MSAGAAARWGGWSACRRTVQLAALAGFVALIAGTATASARGFAVPPLAWLPFRLDPLVGLSALLAGSAGLAIALWTLAAVAFAMVAGRAFCGWLCPLGTLLDLVRRATAPLARRLHRRTNPRPAGWSGRLPLAVLTALLLATALGLPLIGVVEPLALCERAAATAVAPWLGTAAAELHARPAVDHVPAPGFIDDYRFIGAPVRATEAAYALGWVAAAVLGIILAAELTMPRWWCRTLCPSGAALGLLARWSLLRRLPGTTCGSCRACVERCRMGAFASDGTLITSACTACMSCLDVCPTPAARVAPAPAAPRSGPDITRRGLLAAGLAGAALPLVGGRAGHGGGDPHRVRPPGVAEGGEARFLEACVRCGACVRACPTRGLQPVILADGLSGLFAPRLVPRQGPCEHDCRACAAVCPTGAIPLLDLAAKRKARLGLAVHDHHRCLPWSGGGECRVCQEHCPAEGKAITLKLGFAPNGQAIPLPAVDAERCVGCGTCEFVCPIEGAAGIRVVDRPAADVVRARFQPATRTA